MSVSRVRCLAIEGSGQAGRDRHREAQQRGAGAHETALVEQPAFDDAIDTRPNLRSPIRLNAARQFDEDGEGPSHRSLIQGIG